MRASRLHLLCEADTKKHLLRRAQLVKTSRPQQDGEAVWKNMMCNTAVGVCRTLCAVSSPFKFWKGRPHVAEKNIELWLSSSPHPRCDSKILQPWSIRQTATSFEDASNVCQITIMKYKFCAKNGRSVGGLMSRCGGILRFWLRFITTLPASTTSWMTKCIFAYPQKTSLKLSRLQHSPLVATVWFVSNNFEPSQHEFDKKSWTKNTLWCQITSQV